MLCSLNATCLIIVKIQRHGKPMFAASSKGVNLVNENRQSFTPVLLKRDLLCLNRVV